MNTEFLNDMQPNLTERLGRFYCRDVEYKKALKRENELFGRLEKDVGNWMFPYRQYSKLLL